jgi:cell division protein FtsW (lipid II flippase)
MKVFMLTHDEKSRALAAALGALATMHTSTKQVMIISLRPTTELPIPMLISKQSNKTGLFLVLRLATLRSIS